jgi:hypothetical protein
MTGPLISNDHKLVCEVVTGEALWCEEGLLEEHQDHSSGVNPVEGPHMEVPLVEVKVGDIVEVW